MTEPTSSKKNKFSPIDSSHERITDHSSMVSNKVEMDDLYRSIEEIKISPKCNVPKIPQEKHVAPVPTIPAVRISGSILTSLDVITNTEDGIITQEKVQQDNHKAPVQKIDAVRISGSICTSLEVTSSTEDGNSSQEQYSTESPCKNTSNDVFCNQSENVSVSNNAMISTSAQNLQNTTSIVNHSNDNKTSSEYCRLGSKTQSYIIHDSNKKHSNNINNIIDLSKKPSSIGSTPRNSSPYYNNEEELLDFSADDDEDDYVLDEVDNTVAISDDKFYACVIRCHKGNYHNSRFFFQKNTDLKYGNIDAMEVKKNTMGIKKLLNIYLIREKLTNTNLIPYCMFLSALMTNFDIDVGMRKEKFTTATCPCSKKYKAWMEHLHVDDTISCSKRNFTYTTIRGFMAHLLDIGIGENNEPTDLYHYITACYMY